MYATKKFLLTKCIVEAFPEKFALIMGYSRTVFLNSCAVEFFRCAAKSRNVQESVQKEWYFHQFRIFFTWVLSKTFYRISDQKGREALLKGRLVYHIVETKSR
jgi:hypothetical protein